MKADEDGSSGSRKQNGKDVASELRKQKGKDVATGSRKKDVVGSGSNKSNKHSRGKGIHII